VKCERSMCPDLEGCHMILYRPKRHDSCCDVCAGWYTTLTGQTVHWEIMVPAYDHILLSVY